MDALLERPEGLALAFAVDHDLAVEDVVARRQLDLWEVARQVLARTRLKF
jgi:hypothetical protein